MTTSPQGRAQITAFEGCKLAAYKDVVGIWTVGVGHTGADVFPGLHITPEQADKLLSQDVESTEECINRAVKVALTQPQFDMLVSLTFNIGCGAFQQSTLLKLLNAGDMVGSASQFLVWNKAGKPKMPVPGITKRRLAERDIFIHGYREAA